MAGTRQEYTSLKEVKQLKISEILFIDARKEGALEAIHEALYKLPFFNDKISITTDELEEAIKKMQKKYPVMMAYITTSPGANEDEPLSYFSFMVKRTDNHAHIKTVYSMTLHEGLAKVVLLMFGFIQKLKNEGSVK